MKCPNDKLMEVVILNLRKRGMALVSDRNGYRLKKGKPDLSVIEQAIRDHHISIAEDGTVYVAGEYIQTGWDTGKIRRKVEDHIRKTSSVSELVGIAANLGISI
ncbi:hypothetical protein GURASL_15690 [Geotalea uraniireducens]|uniref:Uncharacterized protein n=1 Tax=Geotalea uraniireducens TaxID=351604 RepID=A0ABM8EJF5_9BACT|nr:hypothetical protein [Geotalea uraniireducens]BDV42646.1 hypothetical protein GURASL_15690 [Geotalea uraniireducens]